MHALHHHVLLFQIVQLAHLMYVNPVYQVLRYQMEYVYQNVEMELLQVARVVMTATRIVEMDVVVLA